MDRVKNNFSVLLEKNFAVKAYQHSKEVD